MSTQTHRESFCMNRNLELLHRFTFWLVHLFILSLTYSSSSLLFVNKQIVLVLSLPGIASQSQKQPHFFGSFREKKSSQFFWLFGCSCFERECFLLFIVFLSHFLLCLFPLATWRFRELLLRQCHKLTVFLPFSSMG